MFVQHASKQNQAISKMHWTKSISAKNLAQNATASQVSSKCIRSHESLNKPYYKYVLAMIGAGTAGQSQEMPPLPPVGAEVRLVRISSESSFKWAYTLALAKQLMITRKKSLSKREVSEKNLVNLCEPYLSHQLANGGFAWICRIGHGGS